MFPLAHTRLFPWLVVAAFAVAVIVPPRLAAGDEPMKSSTTQPSTQPISRPLVGISYFPGWWVEKPNKWTTPRTNIDWREQFPERRPTLGEYNTQETTNAEIALAAEHGVDFFAILWYPPSTVSKESPMLARGLEQFIHSPNAKRMKFIIEFCNHPPFATPTEKEWEACIAAWMPAFKHPSHLRVGGRLVFKVHAAGQFWADAGEKLDVAKARLDKLRAAVRAEGLGEMVIGAGGLGPISPDLWPVKLFDFTGDYMMVPPLAAAEKDYPFEPLAEFLRDLRLERRKNALPYMPVVAAGWNPRPWKDPRPTFAFPTREQWVAELRRLAEDFREDFGDEAQAKTQPSGRWGIPRPDGTIEQAFTIYAWNEFGEGGIVAPTRGEGAMKLEGIREVFGVR
ncbi:MAG: hypothetical protein NTW19_01815 [Planctomycetota bacterium]|nr:hypothetical protein [Planctomycetota bacterium]